MQDDIVLYTLLPKFCCLKVFKKGEPMSFKRLLSLACLFGFFFSLDGAMNQYLVYDHQIYNFFTQRCKFDIEGEWNKIFTGSKLKTTKKLSTEERKKLFNLRGQIGVVLNNLYSTLPTDELFFISQESLEALIGPKIPGQDLMPQAMNQAVEQKLAEINQTVWGRIEDQESKKSLQSRSFKSNNLTKQAFLDHLVGLILKFFDPKSIEIRLNNATEENNFDFIKKLPVISIGVIENEETGDIKICAFPTGAQADLDCPDFLYHEMRKKSSWGKTLCYAGIAGLAATAGLWAYENWGDLSGGARELKDSIWNPNECGDDLAAGPECTRPWEIRCQGENCGPEMIGPDDTSWFVVGKCSAEDDNCPAVGYQSIAMVGGRDVNGVAHCRVDKPLSENLALIGQIAPGAWKCPAGKSPFHFLQDGRLCFYRTPIIRAGIDTAACDPAALYCKLPGGLTLFRHGEDMLLTPPCGQGVKICKISDLKLYLHEDGKYTESSPCDPVETGGICVFDENLIEFYNPETKLWQDKPVDWVSDRMLYRFKTGEEQEVKVFCKADGSCTIKFPCALSEGKCPVDTTVFYSKKGSNVWTEGMPCGAEETYCIIENNQVFYPHQTNEHEVTWKEVPAWTGEETEGIYTGPDGKNFIPSLECTAWEPLPAGQCFAAEGGLFCVSHEGQTRYWHTNKDGECGWKYAPVCTGAETDGICTGPDGKVFILNDDLSAWIPMPDECSRETSLFCVKNGAVKYWHKGLEGKSGSWHDVPSCEDFAEENFCVGPDKNVFTRSADLTTDFELLKPPVDQSISSLVRFNNDHFAAWFPQEKMWKVDEAPCSEVNHYNGYCTLGDGNELYSVIINNKTGERVWRLKPDVDDAVNKIKFNDGSRRWRQVPVKGVEWTPVMPCEKKDACSFVVTKEQLAKLEATDGHVRIEDEEECEICPLETVKTYRPGSHVTNINDINQ